VATLLFLAENPPGALSPPIDPNGCAIDVQTFGHRRRVKFWRDADTLVWMRWYRVPYGTPVLPIPHTFMFLTGVAGYQQTGPFAGEAGVDPDGERYYSGARPIGFAPDGSYVGTSEQWLRGSLTALPVDLTGQTLACLAQLGRIGLLGCGRRAVYDGLGDNFG
jgi:hypothetical protein